jgi:hypothetical protein
MAAPCLQQVHHGHQQLLELPPELLHYVLSYLSPSDLVAASRACRALHSAARDDRLWHALVQANVPGVEVSKPYPHASFRELYPAHEPYWFLPRYKIWFGDWDMIGRVVIALYDPRRGCIEGYQLLARREREKFRSFGDDDSIVIHEFEPKVGLHRDRPVLKLNAQVPDDFKGVHNAKPVLTPSSRAASHRFPERNMRTGIGEHDQLSAVKRLSNEGISAVLRDSLGQRHMWPPSKIPSRDRVARGCTAASRPSRRAEMSDQAFQLRRSIGVPALDLHDLVVTYSTLDPALYTPTEEKPWRGIWVGDYSGHGCEFLLVHQPDDDVDEGDSTSGEKTVTPSSSPCRDERRDGETEEEFAARQKTARTYRGRLEAIKLTGDPNIPRGEFSFVAPDLGEDGYVGTLQKEPFVGARMVKSFGHVASRGFIDRTPMLPNLPGNCAWASSLTGASNRQVHQFPPYPRLSRPPGTALAAVRPHQLLCPSRYRPASPAVARRMSIARGRGRPDWLLLPVDCILVATWRHGACCIHDET